MYEKLKEILIEKYKAIEIYDHHESIILYCFILLFVYFVFGIVFYCYIVEDFNFWDALYFCIITFTTTGYGDFHPTNATSKLFTCFYIIIGFTIVIGSISYLSKYLTKNLETLKTSTALRILNEENDIFNQENDNSKSNDIKEVIMHHSILYKFIKYANNKNKASIDLIIAIIVVFLVILIGALFYTYIIDDFSFIDGIYLSTVTVGTIGYGDIYPKTENSRIFTIFYCLIGSILCAKMFGRFSKVIINYSNEKDFEIIMTTELSKEELDVMDSSNDHIISKEEFILYKLKKLGFVDDELILAIVTQFNKLDIDNSNSLTVDDIKSFFKQQDIFKSNKEIRYKKVTFKKVAKRLSLALNKIKVDNNIDSIDINKLKNKKIVCINEEEYNCIDL
jgi:potassium channel subfamily K